MDSILINRPTDEKERVTAEGRGREMGREGRGLYLGHGGTAFSLTPSYWDTPRMGALQCSGNHATLTKIHVSTSSRESAVVGKQKKERKGEGAAACMHAHTHPPPPHTHTSFICSPHAMRLLRLQKRTSAYSYFSTSLRNMEAHSYPNNCVLVPAPIKFFVSRVLNKIR